MEKIPAQSERTAHLRERLEEILEQGGEWTVDKSNLYAFYIPEELVAEVERALAETGHVYEGDDRDLLPTTPGGYLKFRVTPKSKDFMFRVDVKE